MHREVLLAWLAGLFGLMAVTLAVAAVVVSWAVLLVALPLAGMAALLWYHASGRLEARMRSHARRRRARQQARQRRGRAGPGAASAGAGQVGPEGRGGPFRGAPGFFGAGPGRGRWRGRVGPGERSQRRAPSNADPGMSRERARAVLGVDATADDEAVRAAYRSKVKETHPDRGGDRETFMRVTEAYEALGGST